jgi:hypothetical protein
VGERNEADGFVGVEEDGTVSAIVTVRQGTAAELNAIVLADGELAIVTDIDNVGSSFANLRWGDGVTAGGNSFSSCGVFFSDTVLTFARRGLAWFEYDSASTLVIKIPSDFSDASYIVPMISVNQNEWIDAVIVCATLKTDTGDRGTNTPGEMVINTNSKTIKMYADGGWRTLASW